jgi:hypothetical protein
MRISISSGGIFAIPDVETIVITYWLHQKGEVARVVSSSNVLGISIVYMKTQVQLG